MSSGCLPGQRGGECDHRPVPQVHRVRADADPAQRRHAEYRRQPPAARPPRVQRRGRDRGEQQAAGIDRGFSSGEMPERQGENKHARHSRQIQPPGPDGGQLAQREGESKRRAEQQRGCVGVGAVIHEGRIGRSVENRHRHRRSKGAEERDRDPRTHAVMTKDEKPQNGGPHQIELLLDGERPQMLQWRQRTEALEVRHVVQDLIPVAGVSDRGEQGGAQFGAAGRLDDRGGRAHRQQHHRERRQQATSPADPEVTQPRSLPGEQVGDEETAQHEEHVDAEKTAAERVQVFVVTHDGEDRDRAHAI